MAGLSKFPGMLVAAGALVALSAPAAMAQSSYYDGYGYQTPYGYQDSYGRDRYDRDSSYRYERRYRSDTTRYSSDWSVAAQRDRPGDYRCDAFWDANRSDCDARWRDQRGRSSYGYGRTDRRDHRRYDDGYGYGYGYNYGYGYGYAGPQPYYGSEHRSYRSRYDSRDTTTYYGAYGRPDVVYGGGGSAYGQGRDPRRIDWCSRTYRSYDPRSGYYRAYSGRLVYCG